MKYELPTLPYAYDALEPYISEEVMKLHHDKHHQTYVDKLNAAIDGYPEFDSKPIEYFLENIELIPEQIKQAVVNHGGGHANHSFFWNIMKSQGGNVPTGRLLEAIDKEFGDLEKFKDKFSNEAMSLFGSGWTWLVTKESKLKIISTQNQNTPLSEGCTPLIAIDLWEHAYYPQYQNRRAEYVKAWWNVINWENAQSKFIK